MSRQNVEVVERLVQELASGDYDAATAELQLDAEWHNTAAFPGPRTYLGRERIREFWRGFFGTFERGGMEVERAVESGDDVVVTIHAWGRGAQSGVPLDVRWACACHVVDGKVTRLEAHGDFQRALEAVGLRE